MLLKDELTTFACCREVETRSRLLGHDVRLMVVNYRETLVRQWECAQRRGGLVIDVSHGVEEADVMNVDKKVSPLNSELERVVQSVLSELGLELIRFHVGGSSRQARLTVYVDRFGGVTVGECVEATRRLQHTLTDHYGDRRRFSVGVSSPGTDRPLKTQRDFSFVAGKRLVLRYRAEEGSEAELRADGELKEAREEGLVVHQALSDEPLLIAYDRILDARIKLPY